MKVSRTPMREAFNRLALEGLIVVSPYRGYAAAPVTVEQYTELCELRRTLEGGASARAAERASRDEIGELARQAETRYTPGVRETYVDFLRVNSHFHLALVRCTRNQQLESVVMAALDRHQRPLYLRLDIGIDQEASRSASSKRSGRPVAEHLYPRRPALSRVSPFGDRREVYRLEASSKAAPGTPPIFFLHGGPSSAGLDWPRFEAALGHGRVPRCSAIAVIQYTARSSGTIRRDAASRDPPQTSGCSPLSTGLARAHCGVQPRPRTLRGQRPSTGPR